MRIIIRRSTSGYTWKVMFKFSNGNTRSLYAGSFTAACELAKSPPNSGPPLEQAERSIVDRVIPIADGIYGRDSLDIATWVASNLNLDPPKRFTN